MSSELTDLRVTGFVRDDGACGKYRISQPLIKCEEHGLFKKELIWPGDSNEKVIEKVNGAHVIVIPRPYDSYILELMQVMQAHDMKVVVEHDDNMFDISPLSNHYQEFGTENVQINVDGDIRWLWQDGENINLKENRARIDGFKRAIEMADTVQVTQPILADVYRQFNDSVYVLPNCVDGKAWNKLSLQEHDDIRIMWSGGSSHYQDIFILKDVLPIICRKYPQVKVMFMGCQWTALIKNIPDAQYGFVEWVHTEAYPYKQASLGVDIALIPLEDNRFNRCKSHIKLIEQAFLQVPAVTSYVSPYREFYAGNNMVMVHNDNESWIEGISRLVEDAGLRRSIGEAANVKARAEYDADEQCELWAKAYIEIANS